MKTEFTKEREILHQKVEVLHELATDAWELCGGTYEDNLNGTVNYFSLNGKSFKMTIEKF